MADLPSILGGMAQGFLDFGKSAVDLFGTGGASIADLIESARTGKVTTKNSDDFRKWLYDTDDVKDAAAKGLGTALNGVQTVSDYIPGIGAVTRNPLFNAGQGALGGLADEFKTYGKDYDLGRAGQRAAVSAGGALASTGLADALKGSGNALLKSGTAQGLARGAVGGAISGGGYAAIDGGDVLQSALQGAGTGAALGGTMGALQDFRPAKATSIGLTDDERQARIANAQQQIDDIGPVRRFTDDPDELAKRARVNELQDAIKAYQGGFDTVDDYNAAMAAKRANKQPSLTREEYEAKMQQRAADLGGNYEVTPEKQAQFDRLQAVNPMRDNYHTGIRAPKDIATLQEAINSATDIDPEYKALLQKALNDDSITVYSSYPIEEGVFTTPIKSMAQDYAGPNNQVYSKTISPNDIAWIDNEQGNYIPRTTDLGATLAADDMTVNSPKLTPEQEAYFKDSVIRDENGNLMPVYHSSPNKFTEFDDARIGQNTMYDNTGFGHFVTPDKDFSARFRDIDNAGIDGNTMELYANVKNPITHPYMAGLKYDGADLDNVVEKYLKATDNADALDMLRAEAAANGTSLYDEYMNTTVDQSPFEFVPDERELLKNKGYDAVELVEGRRGELLDDIGKDNTPVSSYAVFSGNNLKDISNLKPTSNPDVMLSKALPEDADLAKTLSKSDEAINRIGSKDVAPIDKSTLPKGWSELQALIDKEYVKDIPASFGLDDDGINNLTNDQLKKYILDAQDGPNQRRGWESRFEMTEQLADSPEQVRKALEDVAMWQARDKYMKKINDLGLPLEQRMALNNAANKTDNSWGKEKVYINNYMAGAEGVPGWTNNATTEADAEFSDRLGIGQGHTLKQDFVKSPRAVGQYYPGEYSMAVQPYLNKENAVSTLAHERLHSFQEEAKPENVGRYNKEVIDAYNELSKDLEPFIHDKKTIQDRYKTVGDTEYWGRPAEQESRMMQQYLDNKGFTKKAIGKYRQDEWGDEINPAFDKFFDKLRDLSKRGVALPAITALLGGGALMASQQKDKEEVK